MKDLKGIGKDEHFLFTLVHFINEIASLVFLLFFFLFGIHVYFLGEVIRREQVLEVDRILRLV